MMQGMQRATEYAGRSVDELTLLRRVRLRELRILADLTGTDFDVVCADDGHLHTLDAALATHERARR